MTCKDCIHYDVCEDNLKYIQERFLKGLTFGKSEFTDGEFCNLFKDKSRIIELPCKVGDEIYVLNRGNIPQKMILDEPDIRCHCAKEDNLCMALCDDKKHNICAYRFKNDGSDIGKKVFRTKSEAETRLKELDNGTT